MLLQLRDLHIAHFLRYRQHPRDISHARHRSLCTQIKLLMKHRIDDKHDDRRHQSRQIEKGNGYDSNAHRNGQSIRTAGIIREFGNSLEKQRSRAIILHLS